MSYSQQYRKNTNFDLSSITQLIDAGKTEFNRTGYSFNEWQATVDGEIKHYSDGQKNLNLSVDTFELSAQWNAHTYQIKYVGNGSTSGSMTNSEHTYDVAKNLTQNAYSKTGYSFDVWSDGKTTYIDQESVINLASAQGAVVELSAQWTLNKYTVTFTQPSHATVVVKNGTTPITSGTEVDYGTELNVTATPDAGYKFVKFNITGLGDVTENPKTFTVTQATTITTSIDDDFGTLVYNENYVHS